MSRKNINWLIVAILLAVGLAVSGYFWWQIKTNQAIAVASIPQEPSLSAKPAALSQRIQACEQDIRAGSGARAGLAELSQLYHANGFSTEASLCYQGLLRIDPSNPRWPHRFASILAGFGQLDDAIILWRKTVTLNNEYIPAQIRLADAYLKRNQPTEAAQIYSTILKREPENPYALLGMARIDMDAGRLTNARERLELAATRSNYTIGYDLLVSVYEQLGDTKQAEAIRARQKAAGSFFDIPDPWLREMYFDCYDSFQLSLAGGSAALEGDLNTAIGLLERAVNFAPKNGYYRTQVAAFYRGTGNLTKAREHLEAATTLAPDLADAWQDYIILLESMGQTQEAERALANGLIHCPDSAGLHFARGENWVAAGNFAQAIPDFKQAAAILNDDARPSFELASIYFRLGRPTEALSALQNALTAEPEFPSALSTLANYYIRTGDEINAQAYMQRVKAQPRIKPPLRLDLEQEFNQRFGHMPY